MSSPQLLHDLLDGAVARHPDAVAVSDAATNVSYRELAAASRRIAAWLARQGVRRGDRVIIAAPPDVLLPALLFGCSRAGAAFVVTRERSPAAVLAHLLDDAEPALFITDVPDDRLLAVKRGIAAASVAQARAAATTGPVPRQSPAAPIAVDPACLLYTSGSTGRPKAVVSTHAQVTFAASAIQAELGYRRDDVIYSALPLSFDYGLYQVFLATLGGGRVYLAAAAQAGTQLLASLHATGATVLPAVPSLAAALARMLARRGAKPPPLRLLTTTGAAMPAQQSAALRAQIPGLRVRVMYGLTECKRATIMPDDEDLRRPGASGRALPGTEVFVVSDTGDRLPAGVVGEIVVRGPHVMAGYWRCPELTATRFRRVDGLFPQLQTGDYGWLDEDGYLYFAGRRDEQYKERGFRVSATEVEAAAQRVPGVQAAAVLPPADGHDEATLFAVTELAADELLTRLRDELEDFKVPRSCLVVSELPLTENRKVDRASLARLLEARPRA